MALVTTLSIAGSVLLYLSMFQLASGGSSGSSMSMMTMRRPHHVSLHAEPISFYLGLALLISAFAFSFWRRHRHECRPLFRLPEPLTARR